MMWTDELWQAVKQLWEEGKTGGEICKLIPGLNRNSVMGKLFRHRRDGDLAYRKPRAMTVRNGHVVGRASFPRRTPTKRPVFVESHPTALSGNTSTRSFNSISGPSYDLRDLASDECHWPIGDPGDSNFCYCAAPVSRGPYCPHHERIAYICR